MLHSGEESCVVHGELYGYVSAVLQWRSSDPGAK